MEGVKMKRLEELKEKDGYIFIQPFSDELTHVIDNCNVATEFKRDITGAVIKLDESGTDYEEVWFSEAGSPHLNTAPYHDLGEYLY
jgi:hypothetical protein